VWTVLYIVATAAFAASAAHSSSRRLSGHADMVPRIRQEVGPDFRILVEEHRELGMFSGIAGCLQPGVSAERGHKIRLIVGELVERLVSIDRYVGGVTGAKMISVVRTTRS
jgi:hypothetical protein